MYAHLIEWHKAIHFYGNMRPRTFEQFMVNVDAKRMEFINRMVLGEIYLNESQMEKIHKAYAELTLAGQAILYSLPEEELKRAIGDTSSDPDNKRIRWKDFEDAYKAAVGVVREVLNPVALADISKPNERAQNP
jgi:hypothetical protein